MKKLNFFLMSLTLVAGLILIGYKTSALAQEPDIEDLKIELGKLLFFDEDLSINGTQACASCHAPEAGFTGPDSIANLETAIYHGAIEARYGNRKPPSSAYAGDSPLLHYDADLGKWAGGMFWDGRATGDLLGDPLAEQAQGPFLNPLEQALPNARLVVLKVANSSYADLFEQVWGPRSLDFARDVEGSYERIARSISAYENSSEVNPFTSKFDLFWDNALAAGKDVTQISCGGNAMGNCGMGGGGMGGGGMGGGGMGGGGMGGGGMGGGGNTAGWGDFRNLGLTDQELRGLAAFNDPNRANCASCHSLEPGFRWIPALHQLRLR
jgi:cytochrome c peroxidase